MSSSLHVDNKKDILILCNGSTQGLGHTTLAVEGEYSIDFGEQQNKYFLDLHYNGVNIC